MTNLYREKSVDMEQAIAGERFQRYAEAVSVAAYVSTADGARAVMAVADAEQADLRAEVERLTAAIRYEAEQGCAERVRQWERANTAERRLADERAKVARVEALAGELWADPDQPHDGRNVVRTIYRHISAQLRGALEGDGTVPPDEDTTHYTTQGWHPASQCASWPECPERHVCPECEQGKHGNCDGTAWDDGKDESTACTCQHGATS